MTLSPRPRICLFALLATVAACGSDAEDPKSDNPPVDVTGHWSEDTGSSKEGMTLELHGEDNKVLVHTAPDESGGHDHLSGTYSFDATTGKLTVNCALAGDEGAKTWAGKPTSASLVLSAGGKELKFTRGDDPHKDK